MASKASILVASGELLVDNTDDDKCDSDFRSLEATPNLHVAKNYALNVENDEHDEKVQSTIVIQKQQTLLSGECSKPDKNSAACLICATSTHFGSLLKASYHPEHKNHYVVYNKLRLYVRRFRKKGSKQVWSRFIIPEWERVLAYFQQKVEYYSTHLEMIVAQHMVAVNGTDYIFDDVEKTAFKDVYSRIYELMCNLQDYWHTNVSALHDIEGRVSNDIDIGTQFIKQPHVVRVIDCLQKNLELIERKFKGLQYAESMDAVRSTMKMLRRARRHHQKSIFFRCGITAMLLIHVIWNVVLEFAGQSATEMDAFSEQWLSPSSLMFQATGAICLCYWSLALLISIWNTFNINYGYVFQLRSSVSWTTSGVIEAASVVTSVWLVCIDLFFKHTSAIVLARIGLDMDILGQALIVIPSQVFPLVAFIFILFYTLLPVTLNRRLLWTTVGHVVTSPILGIAFRDAFLGNVFSSFSTPFKQACYFFFDTFNVNSTEPGLALLVKGQSLPSYADIFAHESPDISLNISTDIVTLGDTDLSTYLLPPTWALALCSGLPQFWRLMQNCRNIVINPHNKKNIANAFKYALGLSLVILSSFGKISKTFNVSELENSTVNFDWDPDDAYFWAYVFCYTFSMLYSWAWDVFMDWGLLICTKPSSRAVKRMKAKKISSKNDGKTIITSTIELCENSQIDISSTRHMPMTRRRKLREKRKKNCHIVEDTENNDNFENKRKPGLQENEVDENIWEEYIDSSGTVRMCGYIVRLRPMRAFILPVYFIGAVCDFFLRSVWAFSLSPETSPFTFFEYIAPLVGCIEVCRRAMWTLFRVENEHVKHAVLQGWSHSPLFFVRLRRKQIFIPVWRRMLPLSIFILLFAVVIFACIYG